MKTSPNQKTIRVQKQESGKRTIISLEALQNASQQLSGESFKMWLYLAKNQHSFNLALSRADALCWGIGSKSSYDRAIKELIEKGYLQKKNNIYIFYESLNLNIEI